MEWSIFIFWYMGLKIKLIDLYKRKVIKKLKKHNSNGVSAIKKIFLPKYGECLISHDGNSIILWKNDNQSAK